MSRPGWLPMALAETVVQTKLLLRNPVSAFFTLVMPLLFMVMLNFFVGGSTLSDGAPLSNYFVPAIAVFGLVTATFTNLTISTAIARDNGVLKRVYGTPMPLSAHVAGRVFSATLLGLASVVLMFVIGTFAFDVDIPWSRMPMLLLALLLGAACFSALGVAMSMVAPNGKAAPAVANAVIFPLSFVSGIFFALSEAPSWLQTVGRALPMGPLVEVATDQFIPWLIEDSPWGRLAIVAAWGVVGVLLAVKLFKWEPARSGQRQSAEIDT